MKEFMRKQEGLLMCIPIFTVVLFFIVIGFLYKQERLHWGDRAFHRFDADNYIQNSNSKNEMINTIRRLPLYRLFPKNIIIKIVLIMFICTLLFLIVFDFTKSIAIGSIILILYALDLPSQIMNLQTMPELLFTVLLLSGVIMLLKRRFMLSGFLLSMCAITKTVGFYLFIPVIISLFYLYRMKSLKFILIWIIGFSSLITMRYYSNYKHFGKVFYASQGLYFYTQIVPMILSKVNTIDFRTIQLKINEQFDAKCSNVGYIEADYWATKQAIKIYKKYPYEFLVVQSQSFLRLFTASGRTIIGQSIYGKEPKNLTDFESVTNPWKIPFKHLWQSETMIGISLFVWAHLFIILYFAFKGISTMNFNVTLPLCLIYGFLALSMTATEVDVRSRIPLMPALLIFAGKGVKKYV